MADIKAAIENVKSLSRTFQSVIDLADALEGMSSIEQAVNDKKNKIVVLDKEITTKIVDRDKITDELQKQNDLLEQIKSDTTTEADKIINEAKEDAARIKDDAHQLAKTALDKSKAQLKQMADTLASTELQKRAVEQELSDLNAKIERARAKMAELLGA